MAVRVWQMFTAVLFVALCMSGCEVTSSSGTKVADLDYTVVDVEKIPRELQEMIEEKKAADFKLTYEAGEDFYIARGYGEQETGGYSIAVNELYLMTNAIYFKTTLIGPGEMSGIPKAPSFPYIVVKTGKQDKNVVFD